MDQMQSGSGGFSPCGRGVSRAGKCLRSIFGDRPRWVRVGWKCDWMSKTVALSTLVVVGLSVVVSGCAPATKFYTLAKVKGAPGDGSEPAKVAVVVAVGPVALPGYVDRPQIVIRESPYTLRPAVADQWAGGLDDMVPRVLIGNLAERLPGSRIVPFPRVGGPSFDYRVSIDISQFDVDSAGEAVVVASWQLSDQASSKTLQLGDTTARARARSASYEDRVAALSQALADLSDDIARAVAIQPRGGVPTPLVR